MLKQIMENGKGTTLKLLNFPPCGNVKINGSFPSGLEGIISDDSVTVIISNLQIGTHSLEVDSGLDLTSNKYKDIVICKNENEVKTIDFARYFCTLCIDGYDVSYKLYIDDMPCKYFVSTNGIVTGSRPGKHTLLMKSKDKEIEKEIEVATGLNKINISSLFKNETKEKEETDDGLKDEELQKIAEELNKINTVKVSKGGIKIIKPKEKIIEKPTRDVFIPPPLPRIKAKRVESIDSRVSIPPPEVKENISKNTNKEETKKSNIVENKNEYTQMSNVVDITSARILQNNRNEEENVDNVAEESSIVNWWSNHSWTKSS